ncbi:MAG: hypothetical protein KGL11_07925 [Alphaproteobacteria bacterium]|nr:hypothetical protein [Alphaproteobacteria bacterium]
MAAKLTPKMRALKLLVIALGALLLAGIGALAAGVIWRINHASPPRATASAVQRIVLPSGAKIIGADVADGRLVVRTDIPAGGVRIFVFDLVTGAEITMIELAPSSP